ncbi:hypothetical protein LCGC14_1010960 [marine sediment metagenome]|uniref:GATA-type domain-containing protein n=1 Tax=marine sediment metagenome TaxID=412755 RepID=A0A0F9N4R5_9ZZZZ
MKTLVAPNLAHLTNPLVTCPRCGVTKRKVSPKGKVWLEDGANHCKTCVARMRHGG